jgi:branched-chain amino acid transport system permease protein
MTARKSVANRGLRPPNYRGHQYASVLVIGALLVVLTLLLSGAYNLGLLGDWMLLSVVGVGFFVTFGLGGQFAFSQAGFYGLGAYVSAWVTRGHLGPDGHTVVGGKPFLLGLLVAVVIGALVALAFALFVQRTDQFYFAITTLALSYVFTVVFREWTSFSGIGGQVLNIKPPSIGGFAFTSDRSLALLLVGALIVVMWLVVWLERSPLRREAIALRDNARAASTAGVPVLKLRVVVFVLGSALAAFAGSLFAHRAGNLSLDSFSLDLGIDIFLVVLFGGVNSMWGPVIGAAFVTYAPVKLQAIGEHEQLVYGALLIIVMILVPQGLVGLLQSGARRIRGRRGPGPVEKGGPLTHPDAPDAALPGSTP